MRRRPEEKVKMREQDYTCFYQLVKDVAKEYGPIRFVIEDDTDAHHIAIMGTKATINEKEITDMRMRRYIATGNIASHFERLFLRAASAHKAPGVMALRLTLAKLADYAAKYKEIMEISLPLGKKPVVLGIWREEGRPGFSLDGKEITADEAYAFVEKHHGLFLVNMKYGIKTIRKRSLGERNYNYHEFAKRKKSTTGKATIQEDGRLRIDTNSFIDKKPMGGKRGTQQAQRAKKELERLNERMLRPAGSVEKGYVVEEGYDATGKGTNQTTN